ncbi:MAG: hypothetical protein IH859_09860, partial [Chloroflexi bacterium]|nr:hypothetical protein [Chloroflexota bacterium]
WLPTTIDLGGPIFICSASTLRSSAQREQAVLKLWWRDGGTPFSRLEDPDGCTPLDAER